MYHLFKIVISCKPLVVVDTLDECTDYSMQYLLCLYNLSVNTFLQDLELQHNMFVNWKNLFLPTGWMLVQVLVS